MIKRIFVGLLVIIFYVIWLPIAIIKDISSLCFVPFDMNRMFKTYQQFMNNLYSMANFHTQLEESADDIGKNKNELYRQQNIGFSINEDINEEVEEEIYEEETE